MLLSFAPACAAGLLAGWLIQRNLPADVPPATLRQTATTRSEAGWISRLTSLKPPASASVDDALSRINALTGFGQKSPERARFDRKDLLLGLSADQLAGLLEHLDTPDETASIALRRLSVLDPARAFGAALRLGRLRDLKGDINTVCHQWIKKDAQAALQEIGALPEGIEKAQWAAAFISRWAGADPAAAAAHFDRLVALEGRMTGDAALRVGSRILEAWAPANTGAAQKWVASLEDPALRSRLDIFLLEDRFMSDRAGTMAAVFARPDLTGLENRVSRMWNDFYQMDPDGAMDTLAKLPADHPFWQQADNLASGIFRRVGQDKATQLPVLAARLPEGARRDAFLAGFVNAGASNDIPFALQVLPLMGEGREREQAVGTLTELWMRKDPVKTSEWLASLPAGTDSRNNGVARFAENLAPDDPESAARWAETMPDSYWQKESVVKKVMEKWSVKDPAAASAWQAGLKKEEGKE